MTEITKPLEDALGALVHYSRSVQTQMEEVHRKLDAITEGMMLGFERISRIEQDLLALGSQRSNIYKPSPFSLRSLHPVAAASDDHCFPLGAAQDNTRYPRFVARCEEVLGEPLKALDLGCAGGGLVLDFLLKGHEAYGLEGSNYAKKNQLFQWRWLKDRLATCDVTKPFSVMNGSGSQASFDVITMWEVLEHIRECDLPQLFKNIRDHLSPRGLFCASVATFECSDPVTGAVWHVTIRPREWWEEKLRAAGLEPVEGLFHTRDFPRGSGNGAQDWDALTQPDMGFHIVARVRE